MKTKIKRHSRSVLSVVLALSLLLSCMMVGMVATDAARIQSESVGDWSSSNVGIAMNTTIYTSSGAVSEWTVSGTNSSWYRDFDILNDHPIIQ